MFVVEKKFEIEMKLKKEMNNIQELKAAANHSSALASDVCNVLGACEQRLQQLESAVLPLYGDTAKLQHIYQNMEKTVKSLDHVINYYMVARELADLIQAGPHTSSPESLNGYLEALDKLAEAQNYFNKHNATSVELENINQLYNTGVLKLENAFEELLSRTTRPLSPTTIMDMIATEEDSSVDSVSVTSSATSGSGAETLRAAAGWLSEAGRPPVDALLAVRVPAAKTAMLNFKEYLKTKSMAASPLMRAKNNLNRSDSTKKISKIHKAIEKHAPKIVWKASQTFEQSTTNLFGQRRSSVEANPESTWEVGDEYWADLIGLAGRGLCRLARAEQRALLGLVPLPRLPPLLAAVFKEPLQILANDVERACVRWRRACARCGAPAATGWQLLATLSRLQADVARALAPASSQPFSALLHNCQMHCVKSLSEWVEGIRADGSGAARDGTVHQLAAASLALLHGLAEHVHTLGPALASEPAYSSAAALILGAHDRDAVMLAIYMRKVLAQLNSALRTKSMQHPDSLKAIFLLNNTLYLLQGLQRSGLIEVLMLAEPECEANYRDLIQEYKNAYLQSWSKLLAHTVLEEALPSKLRDKDRQMLKDKFASFNRELDACTAAQRSYAVPDVELRESLKRDNKETILPPYTRFYDAYASLPFSKNPDKYVKYTPIQVASQLDGYFDEAA